MSKITEYEPLTSPDAADLLLAVDVSDHSMASSGTDKNLSLGTLLAMASANIDGGTWDTVYGAGQSIDGGSL